MMEEFVRFTNQTQGRERLFRAAQYSCMLLHYLLEQNPGREEVVMKLKRLESNMSSGRKLFRLGNTVHAVVAARQATQLPNLVPRFCLVASNLNRALYFICDTVLWLVSMGFFSDVDQKKWRRRATKCYYYSLVMNLAEDAYELGWRMERAARTEAPGKEREDQGQRIQALSPRVTGGLQPLLSFFYFTLRDHPPLLLDMVKNICDLSSPLNELGLYKTNAGVLGLCGLISSIIGILTVTKPHLKLKP
nr:peroxisomal membrane protein 11A [Pogona vitticeps]